MSERLICEVNPDDVMHSILANDCPLSYGNGGAEKCSLLWYRTRRNGYYGVKCPTPDSRCAKQRKAPPECPLRQGGEVLVQSGLYRAVPELIVDRKEAT